MIRTLGFIGGVTVTSSVAYLTAREFRNNSSQISQHLRESKETIDNVGKIKPYYPDVIHYSSRTSTIETMKDIWNSEVTRTVGWFYRVMGYEEK